MLRAQVGGFGIIAYLKLCTQGTQIMAVIIQRFFPAAKIVFVLLLAVQACSPIEQREVDFNAEVKPILNKNCLACHGGVRKNGGVSFLFEEEAMQAVKSGNRAIVPGKPEISEMIARITSDDPEERMPADKPPLSPIEIDVLRKWIAQGAKWETHWAYVEPVKTGLPVQSKASAHVVRDAPLDSRLRGNDANIVESGEEQWSRNEIDFFVLRKMRERGLAPSPEAGKETLIRRASLDLIGLPPTLEDADAFLMDDSPQAFEKVVDRLLASPHFGEHWASMWLDLARYGDSQGYQKDPYRSIWRYRDWVIQAFNDDMPFDQFTIEQLAGDLLPNATENQILATAFHRNTMTNDEGGTDDEEFRTAAVIDRVNTTWEVWQGTTMSCVQCHSHPYDPFRHEEYFQSFAFFNNTADADRSNEAPTLPTFSLADQERIFQFAAQASPEFKISESGVVDFESLQTILQNVEPGDSLALIEPVRTPIMQELPDSLRRKTHIFERGNWLVHGQEVEPGTPEVLPAFSDDASKDRLALARWLVSPENPLTARVTVNRFWAQIFGCGLVSTLEDFGTQGAAPSHPQLLDWLAVEFTDKHKWSIKKLLKEIVMSATYRQVSHTTAAHVEIDPENIWLARFPRVRLSAEQVRDQALAVSGLLSKKMYGRSVMPPQPDGVWNVIRHVLKWRESRGEDRYRRGLYTFTRKSSPYPSFLTFDSPSREFCVSRRIRTNTPLQALVTLNDPVYFEAAQALARRMANISSDLDEQLRFGYRLALISEPDPHIPGELRQAYEKSFSYYQGSPEAASQVVGAKNENSARLAALVIAANVILNLDAFLVKG